MMSMHGGGGKLPTAQEAVAFWQAAKQIKLVSNFFMTITSGFNRFNIVDRQKFSEEVGTRKEIKRNKKNQNLSKLDEFRSIPEKPVHDSFLVA